jgi:hypothetical protein
MNDRDIIKELEMARKKRKTAAPLAREVAGVFSACKLLLC